jgi:hypothetical protein
MKRSSRFCTCAGRFQVRFCPKIAAIKLLRCMLVFKIPPLKKNEGHRAQEWGDLGNPLWKGRLRIIEKGAGVNLLFEDPNTGTLPRRSTRIRRR